MVGAVQVEWHEDVGDALRVIRGAGVPLMLRGRAATRLLLAAAAGAVVERLLPTAMAGGSLEVGRLLDREL